VTDPLAQFRLDGEVAVVTGGASGIGRVVAEALSEVGAPVAVFDVAADGKNGYRVDVANEAQVTSAFAEVVARHGRSTCCSTTPASRSVSRRWSSRCPTGTRFWRST
jgi:NAD(P)-dependent dehydrogenase (short-subunit alcohol dehydrogenase family)